ncbi:Homeodomain-interacting protein kinase [Dirofilaria immitis]
MEIAADDGNNNDSFAMNLSRLAEKIDDKNYISGIKKLLKKQCNNVVTEENDLRHYFCYVLEKNDFRISVQVPVDLQQIVSTPFCLNYDPPGRNRHDDDVLVRKIMDTVLPLVLLMQSRTYRIARFRGTK